MRHDKRRTLIAAAFAPVVVPVLIATLGLIAGAGPILGVMAFLLSAASAYLGMLVVGLPAVYFLQRSGHLNVVTLIPVGIFGGILTFLLASKVLGALLESSPDFGLLESFWGANLGLLVAMVFYAIARSGKESQKGGAIKRLAIFVAFFLASMLVAGIFGAVHDQISYSFSNEYFTKFKFIQFGLTDMAAPDRIRAAIVGFLASWWMGVPLGFLSGLAGFIQTTPRKMLVALAWSLPLMCAFVLFVALLGYTYGIVQTSSLDLSNRADWFIPAGLEQPRRFICVGYMHNSAYLGGAVAIPASWVFHILYRLSSARAA